MNKYPTPRSPLRPRLFLFLLSLVVLAVPAQLQACELCAAVEKAKRMWEEAKQMEAEAINAAQAGNMAKAGRLWKRAVTLKGNACYKIRGARSKHGIARTNAKMAAIWPDAPSDDECEDAIDDLQGLGGGGGGGSPLGALGAAGFHNEGGARGGVTNLSGTPGTNVSTCVFIVGTDDDQLPEDFTLTITEIDAYAGVSLVTSSPVSITGLTYLEKRLIGVEFAIGLAAIPGGSARYEVRIVNNATNQPIVMSSTIIEVFVVGDTPDLFSSIEVVPLDYCVDEVNGTITSLRWHIYNRSTTATHAFYLVLGPTRDPLSRDLLLGPPQIPLEPNDFFPMPPAILPPVPGGALPPLPIPAPESMVNPIELGPGDDFIYEVEFCAPYFCEVGMTVCCQLRLQSATSPSAYVDYQQYIFNRTLPSVPKVMAKILVAGQIQNPSPPPLHLDLDGTPVFVPLMAGMTGEDVVDMMSQAINRVPARFDGSAFKVNGLPGGEKLMITGIDEALVSVVNPLDFPGLVFMRCEDPVGLTPIPPLPVDILFNTTPGGIWDGTINLPFSLSIDPGVTPLLTPVLVYLMQDGGVIGGPLSVPDPSQLPMNSPQIVVDSFFDVHVRIEDGPLALAADLADAAAPTEDPTDNIVPVELRALDLRSVEPITITGPGGSTDWFVEVQPPGQPQFQTVVNLYQTDDITQAGLLGNDPWNLVNSIIANPNVVNPIPVPASERPPVKPKTFLAAAFGRDPKPDACVIQELQPGYFILYFPLAPDPELFQLNSNGQVTELVPINSFDFVFDQAPPVGMGFTAIDHMIVNDVPDDPGALAPNNAALAVSFCADAVSDLVPGFYSIIFRLVPRDSDNADLSQIFLDPAELIEVVVEVKEASGGTDADDLAPAALNKSRLKSDRLGMR